MFRSICFKQFLMMSLLLANGCAITVDMPANRFQTPETGGQMTVTFEGAGLAGIQQVELTQDYVDSPPSENTVSMEREQDAFHLGAEIGILRWMDVFVRIGNVPIALLGVKTQVIGNPSNEAKAGNFSLSTTVAYGYDSTSGSGAPLFSSNERKFKQSTHLLDAGLIVGYRFHQYILAYTSGFFTWRPFNVNWDIANDPSASVRIRDEVLRAGGCLGLEGRFSSVRLMLEFAVNRISYNGQQRWDGHVGGSIAHQWF